MSNRRNKSKSVTKAKGRAKSKPTSAAATPAPATKYRLTVAADKLAVLLRLPKATIKIIDGMAREGKSKRTSVIYGIIGAHPSLTESMRPLITDTQ